MRPRRDSGRQHKMGAEHAARVLGFHLAPLTQRITASVSLLPQISQLGSRSTIMPLSRWTVGLLACDKRNATHNGRSIWVRPGCQDKSYPIARHRVVLPEDPLLQNHKEAVRRLRPTATNSVGTTPGAGQTDDCASLASPGANQRSKPTPRSLHSPVVKDASVSGAAGRAAVAAGEPNMMDMGSAPTHMDAWHVIAWRPYTLRRCSRSR